jgi:hypothetical protein
MMVIVASDGYILNVLGPYRADGKNNDACITKHILGRNEEGIKADFSLLVNKVFANGVLCSRTNVS